MTILVQLEDGDLQLHGRLTLALHLCITNTEMQNLNFIALNMDSKLVQDIQVNIQCIELVLSIKVIFQSGHPASTQHNSRQSAENLLLSQHCKYNKF